MIRHRVLGTLLHLQNGTSIMVGSTKQFKLSPKLPRNAEILVELCDGVSAQRLARMEQDPLIQSLIQQLKHYEMLGSYDDDDIDPALTHTHRFLSCAGGS